ncbi:MAG: hypothetical protein ACYSWP_05895 [Planctomycetota bacterium]
MNTRNNPTQPLYCSSVLISRSWRIPQNNQLSIINNQWKGEPNLTPKASTKPQNPLRYIFKKFKNIQKYSKEIAKKRTLSHLITHLKVRFSQTFMQNEPNFMTNAPAKHAKDANFTQIVHSLLQLFTRQMPTFPKKLQKMSAFCNFQTLKHLTPYTTMTYINIPPEYASPFTRYKKCKTNPISTTHLPRNVIPARRDSSTILFKTNPILNPSPLSPSIHEKM